MHNAIMSLTVSRADHDLRWIDRCVSVPRPVVRAFAWCFSAWAAYRVRSIAERLSVSTLRFVELTSLVENTTPDEAFDLDGQHVKSFDSMLANIKAVHSKAISLRQQVARTRSLRLIEAAEQLVAICAEYHEAVVGLTWAILEHDATCAQRRESFHASNAQDVMAMLDRIAAGQ